MVWHYPPYAQAPIFSEARKRTTYLHFFRYQKMVSFVVFTQQLQTGVGTKKSPNNRQTLQQR